MSVHLERVNFIIGDWVAVYPVDLVPVAGFSAFAEDKVGVDHADPDLMSNKTCKSSFWLKV